MKKLCLTIALAGILATPSLFAAMSVTVYQDTGNYSSGNGGEFRAVGDAGLNSAVNWAAYTGNTASQGNYFQTFCIEDGEFFSPGTTYSAGISYNSLYGVTGHSPGTPVTMGTAWLYSQFAAGTLTDGTTSYNYAYGAGRAAAGNAGALQQAIWWFQGEAVGVENSWADAAIAALGSKDNAFAAANGKYGVEALNLGDPGQVQDQLVVVPVPEPTTMIAGAGALGLALLGIGRGRRSSAIRVAH